ncbi:EAL domain-containing response regulator [Stutzerimonas tarimensis]|uniref:EAL domain-containing protein n=1 Tax=Stutzerimonas tarimensis TaxID=1507735 RepID=A0ABV7T5Y8_9GAMM
MPKEKHTLRLLILEDSQNEAERLVSLFRNAGHATRAQRLTSHEVLEQALQRPWDLLLLAPQSELLPPGDALRAARQATDLPAIQLTADNDSDAITEALILGARDAVPQGEDERLILVANRELADLAQRRARRQVEALLQEAEKRCHLLLESSADAIAYVHDGMHVYANRSYLDLFGYEDADELEGMPLIDLIAGCDQVNFKDFLRNYQTRPEASELPCDGIRGDGSAFKTQIHLSPAIFDGEPCIQVSIRAETSNAELEEKLREISSQDAVTGLHNRSHFLELLGSAVEQRLGGQGEASLAFIRIDRFSSLQAEIGLADSDQLLAELAQLLLRELPPGTELARFGDDQFTLLQPELNPTQAEPAMAALLRKVGDHLFEIDGRTIQITLSIGIAGLDRKIDDAQAILDRAHRCADDLTEGNGVKRFDPAEEIAAAANRGNVQAMVRQALDNNSFRLLFQPIISLLGDSHEHYEVLLRLLNPKGEEVPPGDFLEAAIEAGLAVTIDRWVLLNSIKLLHEHHAKGHKTRLFVHLCAASLQDPALLPWLGAALKASRLPGDALVFQFDEADATTYLTQAKPLAQGLRSLGCKIAVSHFGRAGNPLNLFTHLPAEFVKVDGSFAQNLSRPEGVQALTALLGELHKLNKLSIVPFIESASMLANIWQAGVNYIQGYYLQGPSQSMNYDFSSEDS